MRIRYTDNDKYWWIFTFAKSSWKRTSVIWSSGGDGECRADNGKDGYINHLTIYLLGYILRIRLPSILRPYKEVHTGQFNYTEYFEREYGFSYSEKAFHFYYGPQTHDSTTTKSEIWSPPWLHWRFYSYRMYDTDGKLYYEEFERPRTKLASPHYRLDYEERSSIKDACPKVKFLLQDYDGSWIIATTYIEEREWLFGDKWCKWLSIFRKPMVRTSLNISFNRETGPQKGSWKGGTTGCGIDILPNESHEDAMRRYCSKEHNSKGGKYTMVFHGLINDNEPAKFIGSE